MIRETEKRLLPGAACAFSVPVPVCVAAVTLPFSS